MSPADLWAAILDLTDRMELLAEAERYGELDALARERHAALEQFFATPAPDMIDEIRAGAERIAQSDRALAKRLEASRSALDQALSRARAGARAAHAYDDTF